MWKIGVCVHTYQGHHIVGLVVVDQEVWKGVPKCGERRDRGDNVLARRGGRGYGYMNQGLDTASLPTHTLTDLNQTTSRSDWITLNPR